MKAELSGLKEQVASISQIPVLSYAWIYLTSPLNYLSLTAFLVQ
ncbi:hypothetical protein [Nostoc sp.]